MEANKENDKRCKVKSISNIPVLIRPLPNFGRPLTRIQHQSNSAPSRDPLKTITSQCVNQDSAGPSRTKVKRDQIQGKKNRVPRVIKNIENFGKQPQVITSSAQTHKLTTNKENVQALKNKHVACDVSPPKTAAPIHDLAGTSRIPKLCKKLSPCNNPTRVPSKTVTDLVNLYSQGKQAIQSKKNPETKCVISASSSHTVTSLVNYIDNQNKKHETRLLTNNKINTNQPDLLNFHSSKDIPQTLNQEPAKSTRAAVKSKNEEYEALKTDDLPQNQQCNTTSAQFVEFSGSTSNDLNFKDDNVTNPGVTEKRDSILKDKLLASLIPTSSFFTPPVEMGSVKKVKRSLKRPHSRGLQSLPPFEVDLAKDSKQIHLDDTDKEASDNYSANGRIIDELSSSYTADVLNYLLSIEKKPTGSNISEECRSCAVNYILQVNGSGGHPSVAQSACWYLDNFFFDQPASIEQLKLTAAACFWIAHKFHGGAVHGMRMVKRAQFIFTVSDLAAEEKAILKKLNFPLQPIVPHEFVPYLAWWCDNTNPGVIEVAAAFLCQCGMTVSKALAAEHASVVAAAAVKTAILLLGKGECLEHLKECPVFQSAQKKAYDPLLTDTCKALRDSVSTIASVNYEYKTALFQYSVAPYYIAPKIMCAAHLDELKHL